MAESYELRVKLLHQQDAESQGNFVLEAIAMIYQQDNALYDCTVIQTKAEYSLPLEPQLQLRGYK